MTFSPVTDGVGTGTLTVTAGGAASDAILLSGSGTSPANLDFQPAAGHDFGDVEVGTQSDLFTATIRNLGTEPATFAGSAELRAPPGAY